MFLHVPSPCGNTPPQKHASGLTRRLRWTTISLLLIIGQGANAATLSPTGINETLVQGNTVTVTRTVTVSRQDVGNGAGDGGKVDVFFLADNTGSMGGTINSIKSNAGSILGALSGRDPRFAGLDTAFGVGAYFGDPSEFYSGSKHDRALKSYKLLQSITSDASAAAAGLSRWVAIGGDDIPEANFFALQQAASEGQDSASGFGTSQVTGWREGAQRIVIWFGDASSHQETTPLPETIAALKANGVTVFGINALVGGVGIDKHGQASAITSSTGGTLKNGINNADAIKTAILDAVGSVIGGTVDLTMSATNVPAGLNVTYICISPQGCNGVRAGESRQFAMTVSGLAPGSYQFKTVVGGVSGLTGNDAVTVTSDSTPPPSGSCGCPATPAACRTAAQSNPALICGTDNGESLLGRPGVANTFCAYGGNDLILGGDQNECFDTGAGNDGIIAGGGDDRIFTGDGDDRVWAGDGNDYVDTGAGDDWVAGGPGDDTIITGDGNDGALAEGGKDILRGGNGNDRLYGGDGDDIVDGAAGDDSLYGGAGNDTLIPGDGANHLDGGTGTDNCNGVTVDAWQCES